MVKIRLARGGTKNDPFYRIIAIEKSRKREGKPLDILGYWHPSKDDLKIDMKKVKSWKNKGAKTTAVIDRLLEK